MALVYDWITSVFGGKDDKKLIEEQKSDVEEFEDVFAGILKNRDVHLKDEKTAHVLISDNDLLSMRDVEGLSVVKKDLHKGIHLKVDIANGSKLENPIHMCVGRLSTSKEPLQQIFVDLTVGDDCEVSIVAHCMFQAMKTIHRMRGTITVGDNSKFTYLEGHIHPEHKDAELIVDAEIKGFVGKGSIFNGDFQLLDGKAGDLRLTYDVDCAEDSITDLTVRLASKHDDKVRIYENAYLNGRGSRALLKSRISAQDEADCEIRNTLIAKAENSRGHVDCQEILKDNGMVTAIPIIRAQHEASHVTHEASLGRVNQKQLETLLAKGLDEDQATSLIIKGMLET